LTRNHLLRKYSCPQFFVSEHLIIYLTCYSVKNRGYFLCQTGSCSLVTSAIVFHFSALFFSRQCNCLCSTSLSDHHNIAGQSCNKYPQRKSCISILLRLPLIILHIHFIILSNSAKYTLILIFQLPPPISVPISPPLICLPALRKSLIIF